MGELVRMDRIEKLQSQVETLQKKVETLEGEVKTLKDRLFSIEHPDADFQRFNDFFIKSVMQGALRNRKK